MSGHTPGPWKVYPYGHGVPHYDVAPRIVSDQPSGRSVNDPISDADARLIAAAPDMEELLLEMAQSDGRCAVENWQARIEGVLKKARGES